MTPLVVQATEVRIPPRARKAIERHREVRVLAHDTPRYVIMHPDDYALVSPLLERVRRGLPVPITDLLDDDDFALLDEYNREDHDLAEGVLESWD